MLYKVTVKNLAKHLDLANHHPDATEEKIRKLCLNVLKYGFNAAFVNPCFISLAREVLKNQSKVGTVISFPLGGDVLSLKREAVKQAVGDSLKIKVAGGIKTREQVLSFIRAGAARIGTSQAVAIIKEAIIKEREA